jgi:hypothetical protein
MLKKKGIQMEMATNLDYSDLVCHIQSIVIWCQSNIRLLCPIRPETKQQSNYSSEMKAACQLRTRNLCKVDCHKKLTSALILADTQNMLLVSRLLQFDAQSFKASDK